MLTNMLKKSLGLLLAAPLVLWSEEVQNVQEPENKQPDITQISEAFGHMIGKSIENIGISFDVAAVIKGLQDQRAGKEAPVSETDCMQAISSAQEEMFQEKAKENLQKAEEFLAKNSKSKGMVSLEEGKVQYKIVQKGSGNQVKATSTPVIKYVGKFIDGTTFGASKEEEVISFEETIPGITKAVVGMKEGEKRQIYIHPDLAYKTFGNLPPNSLIHFEVEVVKADAPVEQKEEVLVETNASKQIDLNDAILLEGAPAPQ